MNIINWLGFLLIGIILFGDNIEVEGRRHHHHHHHHPHPHHHHHHHHHKKRGFFGKIAHKIRRTVSTVGRKLLDRPPKHRSRFDKYPLHLMRYHQFIWKRFFKHHLEHAGDDKPKLPKPNCWSVRCWIKRNKFKHYWKSRANIAIEGKNSPPFLHRRCRLPGTHGSMCKREHLRHDYYWRMFMWIGRYGFPKQPIRKRICMSDYCRFQKQKYKRFWKNFWIYTSLIPVVRPFDYNWKFWMWRYAGNPMRLQQIVTPALMAMGQGQHLMLGGGMMMGGGSMNMMMMLGGRHMTIEMKQALIAVMQRNLAQTMQVASTSQNALQRQRMALMMLMRMPAFPSAISAQMQMQSMMRNVQYQQYMQQQRMQMMLQQQIWGMARYLRGSCGCNTCSHGIGAYGGGIPSGATMYVRHQGITSPVNPAFMARRMPIGMGQNYGHQHLSGHGAGLFAPVTPIPMPINPVQNPFDLKLRVKALYAKNNLPV